MHAVRDSSGNRGLFVTPLPDPGVPLSAALGAVTALTALLAGIGTVRAARRRPDRNS